MIKAELQKVQIMKTQIKLVFSVPLEESYNDFSILEGFKGWLHFQGKSITKEIELAMNDRHFGANMEGKTPSQRLRGTLLTLSHYKDPSKDMEQFYSEMMESIINHYECKIKELKNERN